jgi:hypothetical protein
MVKHLPQRLPHRTGITTMMITITVIVMMMVMVVVVVKDES